MNFLKRTTATINHATGELTFDDDGEVTLSFICPDEDTGLNRSAAVRLVRRLRVGCEQRVSVRVHVKAKDGDVGIFTPVRSKFKQLLVAPTVATARDRHVIVPILSVQGGRATLPPRHLLGTWEPLDAEMTMIEVCGGLQRGAVEEWVETIGGAEAENMPNEDELNTEQLTARIES